MDRGAVSAVSRWLCAAVAAGTVLACAPGDAEQPMAGEVTILYDADERIFGPYWSVEAWFLMFLPLVTWDEHDEIAPGRMM